MRMRPPIHLLQLRNAIVSVTLCCFERGVPHQLLYITHIGIFVQQMGSEGVAQYVGRLLALHICSAQFLLYHVLNGGARKWFSLV